MYTENSPHATVNKSKLTNCSDLAGGTEPTDLPPVTPIGSSERSKKRIKLSTGKTPTKMQVKFRPKVMIDSPITPITPSPSSSGGRRGDPSCRRVLDFGSDRRIQTKSMLIYTKGGGYCFNRQAVRVLCDEKEEEEIWKKEQELFKQRALSFIISMRLVQGIRPYMGWKGSVVDSVVGVFLTQNTADNLSSSAFMSLAAKYPKKINHQNENHYEHALDWNAVRSAPPSQISRAIYGRGMNKRIAKRIQNFLDSIHDEKSGLFDLEWLRNAKPEEARNFLMKIYGLGLKSMECLRLLTLRQHAFPVDTHVCRIVVRLGWVPVEKLPDGVLMHQLEEYPVMNRVQEYLSQRLSNLDVETLCELHNQMITFGKVFCTKKKPNCNSCPMKDECDHFASATTSDMGPPGDTTFTPKLEDIEDLCLSPQLKTLKVEGRLRTKHRVYELFDSHPLLQELDKRDPDDINPYLLVIWPQGEKNENYSVVVEREPSLLTSSDSQEEILFGTLLVPCRTATRGSFPLDGTFFQINEVFADVESSEKPLVVPENMLLNLTTKNLYCGTSITSIFEGMSSKEIQECFWKGYVCIRGFNMKTRVPTPLHEQFHRSLAKTNIKRKSSRKRMKNNRTNI